MMRRMEQKAEMLRERVVMGLTATLKHISRGKELIADGVWHAIEGEKS
jgi:hypothetical protein